MRVAIATESYWPDVNGVATSVVRVAEQLTRLGHEPLVIAPRPAPGRLADGLGHDPGFPVVRIPSWPVPGNPNVRLAAPGRLVADALRAHRSDVVHLASPFVLGAWAAAAAQRLDIPAVAVYQTDMPAFVGAYGLPFGQGLSWRWIRHIHARARITLAPSSATEAQLIGRGVPRVVRWGRGVDVDLFRPERRRPALRHELAPDGELIVGYVGRLAPEKRVELLAGVAELPAVRTVIVGDGPMREPLRRALPSARFLGTLVGADLAEVYASLDVFVHTGPFDTFCQTIQEALASGVPVIAPAAGGPLDLVQPGKTGLLVAPGDSSALTAAVAGLASDTALRSRLAAAARPSVVTRDWSTVVDELIDHYRLAVALGPMRATSGARSAPAPVPMATGPLGPAPLGPGSAATGTPGVGALEPAGPLVSAAPRPHRRRLTA